MIAKGIIFTFFLLMGTHLQGYENNAMNMMDPKIREIQKIVGMEKKQSSNMLKAVVADTLKNGTPISYKFYLEEAIPNEKFHVYFKRANEHFFATNAVCTIDENNQFLLDGQPFYFHPFLHVW